MIYGIGTDICDVTRIEKLLEKREQKFIDKTLTAAEQAAAPQPLSANWLAKRFAAKEAVVKAMGTGFVDGLFFGDVEVFNDDAGKPYVKLSAQAVAKLPEGATVFLSLSDEKTYAVAFAVIELR